MWANAQRDGHWLKPVLCVPFTGVTLMVGWQQGHPACRKQDFSSCCDGQPCQSKVGQKVGGCCAPFCGGELGPHL